MATLSMAVSFPFLVTETLIGMVANGSIVLINFTDWFRRRKLSPMDVILICLGSSRLLLQAVVILEVTLYILQDNVFSYIQDTLISMFIFTSTVNLWFTAWLSVFYLAKIAIFSHPVFLQIKQRFPGLVLWLLLGSVFFSAVITIIFSTSYDLSPCSFFSLLPSNRSHAEMNTSHTCVHIIALVHTFNTIPFIISLSSSTFLISSLWKHMRNIRCNGTGTKDVNTQAHWSAIKSLASFAVLYLISFGAVTSQSVLASHSEYIWTIVLFNVTAVYPTGHAIILILINPKLKQAWVRIIHHFICHLNKAPS